MSKIKELMKNGASAVDACIDRINSKLPFAIPIRVLAFCSLISHPSKLKRRLRAHAPNVIHSGRRGTVRRVRLEGEEQIEKRFNSDEAGRQAFAREQLACELFGDAEWKLPVSIKEDLKIVMPRFPDSARLDRVAAELSEEERLRIAVDALSAALDIHAKGFAHRDLNAKNIFLSDGRVLVSDFETLMEYPAGTRPRFPESYDVIGKGLESPLRTNSMCFGSPARFSLQSILGVPVERALEGLSDLLKSELRDACRSFNSVRGRHALKQERIYCAFETRHFSISREEAQRSAPRRFQRFGITPDAIRGKSVLDLGCNVGAMLFQASQYAPKRALGIELDPEKVAVAERVAAFAGLNELEFRQADIDSLTAGALGEQFDVVFCLAIEAHVRSPERLYELLGQITREVLYFEGNSSSKPAVLEESLRRVGFSRIEHLGMCDDDLRPENNCRPLLAARR